MDVAQQKRWDELLAADDSIALRIEHCERFLRDYPDFGPALLYYGRALTEVSQFDAAERVIRRALKKTKPEHAAYAMCDLGHMVAEEWFRKAIAAEPEDATSYIFLGAMLARSGRLSEAEEMHHRATRCSQGAVDEAYHNLGLVYRGQRRYRDAMECFREAIRRDPDYKAAKAALRDCRRALKVATDDPADEMNATVGHGR